MMYYGRNIFSSSRHGEIVKWFESIGKEKMAIVTRVHKYCALRFKLNLGDALLRLEFIEQRLAARRLKLPTDVVRILTDPKGKRELLSESEITARMDDGDWTTYHFVAEEHMRSKGRYLTRDGVDELGKKKQCA